MRDLMDYEKNYKELPFEGYQVKYRKKKIMEILSFYKPSRILEIGCGMEPLFLDWPYFEKMTIVEPAVSFYENAITLAKGKQGIAVINSAFEEAGFNQEETEFDFVILSSLLHELGNPKKMLRAVNKTCGKKTIVHINVPNAQSIHRLLAEEMGLISNVFELSDTQNKMQQSRTYDMESLIEETESEGFRVIDNGSYFIKPLTHHQMQSCMDAAIFDEKLLDGLYNLERDLQGFGSEIYVNIMKV